ncbi:MAG: hypothetical protein M3463_20735, partial [Verrucomicrobiota bacterium]|nr:hypothetical protein [Verrucomicrobiota bacterium]
TTCGVSMLWHATGLHLLAGRSRTVSVREFLRLHAAGWPEDAEALSERALVVAGLEAVLDALEPAAAHEWMLGTFYKAVHECCDVGGPGDGGREAALIVWLADGNRVVRKLTGGYDWHCAIRSHGKLPLGNLLFNGAESSVREIRINERATAPGFIATAFLDG